LTKLMKPHIITQPMMQDCLGLLDPCGAVRGLDARQKISQLRLYAVRVCEEQSETGFIDAARMFHRGGPRACASIHAELHDPNGHVITIATGALRLQTLSPWIGYRSGLEVLSGPRPQPGSRVKVWYGSQC